MNNESNVLSGIIDVTVSSESLERVYNFYSHLYFITGPFEKKAKQRGIEIAQIKPADKVLEVAIGSGDNFIEILKKVAPDSVVYGVDFSLKMIEQTYSVILGEGFKNFELKQADARKLPYADNTFDVVYNSYMLDLIPLKDLPAVIKEFHRVLKKNGRLILVNLSKKTEAPVLYESIYKLSPALFGGCRPVLMQRLVQQTNFSLVKREFISFPVPSEIVLGFKD